MKVTMFNDLSFDARIGLLQNPDFLEFATSQGHTPQSALDLPEVLTRSQSCVSPVVLDAVRDGEITEIQLPCGTSNALKCPSCAEFSARLRQRQIIRGIEQSEPSDTRVYLFTNTAPSWGRVHRSSIKKSDEYKVRHLWGHKKEKALLTVSKQRGACSCGKYHRYDADVVGTPLSVKTYDYAGEIMWSANLPNLVKSMVRTVRYVASKHEITAKNLGILTVFERQARGSLHAHTLLVVRSNPAHADSFIRDLKAGWQTEYVPTAKIPAHRVAWYQSSIIQRRWKTYGEYHLPSVTLSERVPQVHWKNGELQPGTQFGEIWDIREVSGDRNLEGEKDGSDGFKQAAGYLSKYLTKNQQAASPEAMKTYTVPQMLHFMRLRQATAILTLDVVMWESQKRYSLRRIKSIETQLEALRIALGCVDAYSLEAQQFMKQETQLVDDLFFTTEQLRKIEVELSQPMAGHPLFPILFPEDAEGNHFMARVTTSDVVLKATNHAEQKAARGISIVVNKTLDNLGFTGSLISVSQWGCFLSDLKEEMRAFAESNGATYETDDVEYFLRPDRMREVAVLRANPQKADLKLFDLSTIGTVIQETQHEVTPWETMQRLAKANHP